MSSKDVRIYFGRQQFFVLITPGNVRETIAMQNEEIGMPGRSQTFRNVIRILTGARRNECLETDTSFDSCDND